MRAEMVKTKNLPMSNMITHKLAKSLQIHGNSSIDNIMCFYCNAQYKSNEIFKQIGKNSIDKIMYYQHSIRFYLDNVLFQPAQADQLGYNVIPV